MILETCPRCKANLVYYASTVCCWWCDVVRQRKPEKKEAKT